MEVDGGGAPIRMLAIQGGPHPPLTEGSQLGPLAELADLPADVAEVGAIGRAPRPAHASRALRRRRLPALDSPPHCMHHCCPN